jgi:hypothetical protein
MLVLALERASPAEAGGPRRRAITPCIKINPARWRASSDLPCSLLYERR